MSAKKAMEDAETVPPLHRRAPGQFSLVFVVDLFPVGYFPLIDSEGKPTIGVGADPGLEYYGRSLLPVIG